MKGKYIVVQSIYSDGEYIRTGYGVAYAEIYDGIITILESIPDLSPDRDKIEKMIILYNKFKLSPHHLMDVLTDTIDII